jgi:hypothetical protein
VEGSQRMAKAAESIVTENNLGSSQGGPITVMPGRIEELQALPMQQVPFHHKSSPLLSPAQS